VDSRLESLEELVPVARLLLDGVLEVEHEGRFVSGADAFPLVFADRELPESTGALARLSRDALDYGASLRLDDPIALSWRLYRYNTLPESPEWRRLLPDPRAVAAFLGLDRFDARAGSSILRGDHRLSTQKGWLVGPPAQRRTEGRHALEALREPARRGAARRTPGHARAGAGLPAPSRSRWARRSPACSGRTRRALLPDAGPARHRGRRLAAELHGLPAHGVPFTAEASGTLLSWGVDPPRPPCPPMARRRELAALDHQPAGGCPAYRTHCGTRCRDAGALCARPPLPRGRRPRDLGATPRRVARGADPCRSLSRSSSLPTC
jgi:hypothetical protein